MYKKLLFLCVLVLLSACKKQTVTTASADGPTLGITHHNSNERTQLADLINQYRIQQGLKKIPVSVSLTLVAEAHVLDLENNILSGNCNLHSWSNQGNWTACCYTSDHAKAQCMWDKPKEITQRHYIGNGYEIAAYSTGAITPEGALELWKGSSGHHNVIINRDIWVNSNWQAIGAAVSEHYAVVWFGTEADPDGSL